MSAARAVAAMAAILAIILLLGPPFGPRASEPVDAAAPLGNEEIVRMVAAGDAEATILDAIRARPPAFDVAEDMLDELKLAGVTPAILAAMKARMAQVAPKAPPPERTRAGTVHLVVIINKTGARTLHVPSWADEELKHRLQLPKENSEREIHDLAVFLACITPEHVPDLWRQKSPLGRDPNITIRHEILAFVPGDTPAGKSPKLTLPDRVEAEVDDTEPHDLVLGVAARIGDRWLQLSSGVLKGAKVTAASKPLNGRISSGGLPFEFKIALTAPAE